MFISPFSPRPNIPANHAQPAPNMREGSYLSHFDNDDPRERTQKYDRVENCEMIDVIRTNQPITKLG